MAGDARTGGAPRRVHAAALPAYTRPPKPRQCQQGRGAMLWGLKYGATMPGSVSPGRLSGRACSWRRWFRKSRSSWVGKEDPRSAGLARGAFVALRRAPVTRCHA